MRVKKVYTYTTTLNPTDELIAAIDMNESQGHFTHLWLHVNNGAAANLVIEASADDASGTFATYATHYTNNTLGVTLISAIAVTLDGTIATTADEIYAIEPHTPDGALDTYYARPIVAPVVNIYGSGVFAAAATVTLTAHLWKQD